jgi:hypothetical protein
MGKSIRGHPQNSRSPPSFSFSAFQLFSLFSFLDTCLETSHLIFFTLDLP